MLDRGDITRLCCITEERMLELANDLGSHQEWKMKLVSVLNVEEK